MISILSLLMTAVAISAIGIARESKVTIAKNELAALGQALDSFFALTGRYPTEAEGSAPLVARRILTRQPVDPWGTPFGYRLVAGLPSLSCLGADGVARGEADAADLHWPENENGSGQ